MAVATPPASYVPGGRFDAPFWPSLPESYTKGDILEVTGAGGSVDWIVPFDIELIGFAIACESYDLKDNWCLMYQGKYIVQQCYTKELPEGIHFMTCKFIPKGEKLTFIFHNTGANKAVWFNYQCLRDIQEGNDPNHE